MVFVPQVSVDGHALAFIEDQQAPTYIHNSVVVNGSQVVVRWVISNVYMKQQMAEHQMENSVAINGYCNISGWL